MKLRALLLASTAIAGLAMVGATSAEATPCPIPAVGATDPATGCNFIFTFNSDGSIGTSGVGGNYDGSEDAVIGVINNSGHAISSIPLSNPGVGIFGFDGDGINTYTGDINTAAGMSDPGPGGSNPDSYGGLRRLLYGLQRRFQLRNCPFPQSDPGERGDGFLRPRGVGQPDPSSGRRQCAGTNDPRDLGRRSRWIGFASPPTQESLIPGPI